MTIAILASWCLERHNEGVFIPSTHHLYLSYVTTIYDKVFLLSPLSEGQQEKNGILLDFRNVEIVPLPYNGSYIGALKNWRAYKRALASVVDNVDVIYCRVPDPFAWMPALWFKNQTIMHFVGDTIDATLHNEKWSWLKKKVMLTGYMPEYLLTLKAARRSRVFTNGLHIAEKLHKKGIKATAVISSTISDKDLHGVFMPLPIEQGVVSITYVGYVRFAKGMQCLMEFCKGLRDQKISFHFNLIGSGEMLDDVKSFLQKEKLQDKVTLYGLINDKNKMNQILRNSDLFFFPSLSEGSPRVVIEAMAQGTPVLSTPVGSLPETFINGETIRFFDFNDAHQAIDIVKEFVANPMPFEVQRNKAFETVVSNYTLEKFLSKVFCYEA